MHQLYLNLFSGKESIELFRKFYNRFLSSDAQFTRRIQRLLKFTPKNIHLFKQAFYHSSNQELNYPGIQNNERLEFLGDAILSTVVADYLFKKYPSSDEGFLTKMRSKIVKRKTLNAIAEKMGLDIFLHELNNVKLSKSMLGNALEALLGAVYIEKGFLFTHRFITNDILKKYLDLNALEQYNDNFKSQLLEWCQKEGKNVNYRLIKKFKRGNRDCFKIGVFINTEKVTSAVAYSKKSAEQSASQIALNKLEISDTKQIKSPII